MDRVVTAAEMRQCDRTAIESVGIPSFILMENAGRAVSEEIAKTVCGVADKHVLIIAGKGNNGGDGFVAARHLSNSGAMVTVALLADPGLLSGDALANYAILEHMAKNQENIRLLRVEPGNIKDLASLPHVDIIVDAILGTGFSGELLDPLKSAIQWINNQDAFVVAIDIPSGIDADTGRCTTAVRANLTVTMGLRKRGILLNEGRVHSGEIRVADISIPRFVFDQLDQGTFLISASDVASRLPRRPFNAHKHSVGKIFVLAGSPGFTGAAAMASMAAMRSGAGAVVLGIPKSLNSILEEKVTEVMTVPLSETSDGTLSLDAMTDMKPYREWADVLLVGPGLSRNSETQDLVQKLVREINRPMILDADGLNAFAGKPEIFLQHAKVPIVITPHAGELSRLLGIPVDEIETHRIDVARAAAKELDVVVLLKGAPSVVGIPSGDVYINSTGNPGMATAGAGDVLSGIIAALIGQGMKSEEAAFAGMYVHGVAGDRAASELGVRGMIATDILDRVPGVFMELDKHGEI